MESSEIKIAFLGREFGEIVKEKLEQAGFQLVDLVEGKTRPTVYLLVLGLVG